MVEQNETSVFGFIALPTEQKNGNTTLLERSKLSFQNNTQPDYTKVYQIVDANFNTSENYYLYVDPIQSLLADTFLESRVRNKLDRDDTENKDLKAYLLLQAFLDLKPQSRSPNKLNLRKLVHKFSKEFDRRNIRSTREERTEFNKYKNLNPLSIAVADYYLSLLENKEIKSYLDGCNTIKDLRLMYFTDIYYSFCDDDSRENILNKLKENFSPSQIAVYSAIAYKEMR